MPVTLFTEKKLVLATHNNGKVEEFRSILETIDLELLSSKDFNLPEPKETETSFIGNARIKSRASCQATNLPCLADDSGLEVHALNNQPGVFTADWAETESGRDFKKAMTLVWSKLALTKMKKPFTAHFNCTLVLTFPNGTEKVFEGKVPGEIVWPMRGLTGHGYDPIFLPSGHNMTFGEMKTTKKNTISHRYQALEKFIKFYQQCHTSS